MLSHFSRVRLFVNLWIVVLQVPAGSSVCEILQSRTLGWAAMPPPGDLPNPGVEPGFPALQVDSLPTELSGKPLGF